VVHVTGPGSTAPQSRPWRVAISGGQAVAARGGDIPGYLSLLSLHGLPRVRIDETELTDPGRLRQFDVVIACWGCFGNEPAMRALEQFAYDGGIVISEGWPMPSAQVFPGQRLGPAPVPNMRFTPSDSPLSRGLPDLGVVKCAASYREAGAIIPAAGSRATVLARYTDEETPEKLRGRFRDGARGAPAVLLTPYGKGTVLYYGPSVSPDLSPPDQPPEHFICRVLHMLSQGELTGRLFTGKMDRASFITGPVPPPEAPAYPAPAGPAQEAPRGFEVLEDAGQLQDFRLQGTLPEQGPARVLIGYWSSRDMSEVTVTPGSLTVRHVRGGRAEPPCTAPLAGPRRLMITRSDRLLTVTLDDAVVYSGCGGPREQGALAVMGLSDVVYQPLAPTYFTDDFMREEGFAGEWETRRGAWQVVTSEGKAETGVNPFNYQAQASPEALALTGGWFWSDVSCGVSVQSSAAAVGLMADYADAQHCLLLKLVFGDDPTTSRLQLVQRQGWGDTVLARAIVPAARGDWHRLGLRTSRGRLQGWLNGALVLEGKGAPAACGRIGLYCREGAASFDDVAVAPWVASPPEQCPQLPQVVVDSGAWRGDDDAGVVSVADAAGARLLLPWPDVRDVHASAQVKLGQAEAAGLLLQARDGAGMLVTLGRDGKALRLQAFRRGKPGTVLFQGPVAGSPDQWHRVAARYADARLEISVDGQPAAAVLDGEAAGGTVGLYARGKQPAQFRELEAWSEPADDHLADQATPEFAGVMDRNSWAGRCGAWTPDPARLDRLWHAGTFPGPVRLEAGIHRLPAVTPETTTLLHLSPPGEPASGYTVRARRVWAKAAVELTLSHRGQAVAQANAPVAAGEAYALGLERCGADVLVSVAGLPALTWRDAQARPELCRLGLDNGGQLIVADDVAVSSPLVRDYTFETAPTDWAADSGAWKVSSRWSCAPGWSWFCGENAEGPALAATRQAYVGEVEAVAYFGAKMIQRGGRMVERLADVRFGCCATGGRADSGYHFIVGADDNKRTVLLRHGQEVASSPYQIAQGLIHNDWLRLTIRRRGAQVALWVWDTPLLTWTDPAPLAGGRIAVGTLRNGVVIPRVTIYGTQEPPAVARRATAP